MGGRLTYVVKCSGCGMCYYTIHTLSSGHKVRLNVPELPPRLLEADARRDLDQYAKKRRWRKNVFAT